MMRIIRLLIVIFIVGVLCGYFFYERIINTPISDIERDVVFVINQGENVAQIGENLREAGLIKSELFFKIYVWRTKQGSEFQAGSYILSPALNIKEIVAIFVDGETVNEERVITILEGWGLKDMAEYFNDQRIIPGDNFLEIARNEIRNWSPQGGPASGWETGKPEFLNDAPNSASLEGYLFPDTYRIFRDATAKDIIGKMLDNFDQKLTNQMRVEIMSQGKTIYEIITLASIVEKEVRTEEDMKIAAGLFLDRIKNGQPLQSDATLSYILDDKKPAHTTQETAIDSPYNTYKYRGLPPGPISNPGLNAIKAAIYPTFTEYNYFLNRLDTGETIFSKTYEEHLRNKARYLD